MPEDIKNKGSIPRISQDSIGFPVSAKKYFIMSVLTCSIYRYYWAYKQFRCTKVGGHNPFFAAMCAIVLPISLNSMMSGLEERALNQGAALNFNRKTQVAIGFFVLCLSLKFMDTFILANLVGFISTVLLYKVQKQINAVNAEAHPEIEPDSKFTTWDRAGILAVILLLAARAVLPRIMPH